jgi:sulfide dehydrogenase cytochrome subunit
MQRHPMMWMLLMWIGGLGSVQAADEIHIRTLAASCAACHGTNGNSVGGTPVLAGLDPGHFTTQMMAFRSGERKSTVMHRHAKGLTPEEIEQLAAYFAAQKRTSAITPTPVESRP